MPKIDNNISKLSDYKYFQAENHKSVLFVNPLQTKKNSVSL